MAETFEFEVNGVRRAVNAEPDATLLSVVRDQLGLTGAKYGCGEGQCGACTVVVDGAPLRSCSTTAQWAAGKRILTIEGLARDGRLHPLQQAFLDEQALQCGYCTPGMILTAHAFLRSNPEPTEQQIARFLQGNICRCCVYPRIAAAVARAARLMKPTRSNGG
ncbi:MAG: (2Fe-2S)-binding protein [Terriglobia bacterium]